MFASTIVAALFGASAVSAGAIVARTTGATYAVPSTYTQPWLEPYQDYHTRYLSLGCEKKHNTKFFDDCCHPMLKWEKLSKARPAYCVPSASTAVSSPTANVAIVSHSATASSAAATATSAASDEDEDCDDDDDEEVDDEEVDDEEDCDDSEDAGDNDDEEECEEGEDDCFCEDIPESSTLVASSTAKASSSPARSTVHVTSTVTESTAAATSSAAQVTSSTKAASSTKESSSVEPSSTKSSTVVATTQTSSSVHTTSTFSKTTEKATSTTEKATSTTTQKAAAPTDLTKVTSGSYSGGFGTFYYQGGVAGACGQVNGDEALIAAIDFRRYGDLGKVSTLCGHKLKVTNDKNGKSVVVTVKDACPTCTNANSVDLSKGAFLQIATEEEGEVPISVTFV